MNSGCIGCRMELCNKYGGEDMKKFKDFLKKAGKKIEQEAGRIVHQIDELTGNGPSPAPSSSQDAPVPVAQPSVVPDFSASGEDSVNDASQQQNHDNAEAMGKTMPPAPEV